MRESWASIGAPGPPPTRRGGKRMIARSWAVALMLAVSAPVWAATSQQHVAAARAAEKRSNWRKALREWQAAYRTEINAEYLISIGDAFAHLGRRAEARKQYTAYLADPLALPANAARIKGKIAALEAPRTAKRAAAKEAPVPLPLPELDLPGAKPAAKKTDLALALPELPGPSASDPGTKPPSVAGRLGAAEQDPQPRGVRRGPRRSGRRDRAFCVLNFDLQRLARLRAAPGRLSGAHDQDVDSLDLAKSELLYSCAGCRGCGLLGQRGRKDSVPGHEQLSGRLSDLQRGRLLRGQLFCGSHRHRLRRRAERGGGKAVGAVARGEGLGHQRQRGPG